MATDAAPQEGARLLLDGRAFLAALLREACAARREKQPKKRRKREDI